MVNEYEIKVVDDFLKVPEDRIDDCMEEFKTFISVSRAHKEVMETLGDTLGVDASGVAEEFVWIDDGENNITTIFSTKERP